MYIYSSVTLHVFLQAGTLSVKDLKVHLQAFHIECACNMFPVHFEFMSIKNSLNNVFYRFVFLYIPNYEKKVILKSVNRNLISL